MGVFTTEQKSLNMAVDTLSKAKVTRTAEVGAAGALTAAHVINGVYHQLDSGTPGSRALPDADDLVAAIRGAAAGTSFRFLVHNADGADTLTVTAGSGGTLYGTATIAAGKTREFVVVVTVITASSEAYVAYALATT